MTAEFEYALPALHLRTCRKRTAFISIFLFFHWAMILVEKESIGTFIGLATLALGGLVVYPWRSIPLTTGAKTSFWAIMPTIYGISLSLLSSHNFESSKGLLALSMNLLCLTFVPLGYFRILSPLLLFLGMRLGLELFADPNVFSNRFMATLFISNLVISFVGWRISVWFQDVHRARITQAPLFGKAILGSREKSLQRMSAASQLVSSTGFILQFDLRGFSALVQKVNDNVYEEFMHSYYEIVSVAVGQNGGTIHRTTGDCHVVCFGIFGDKGKPPAELLKKATDTFEYIVEKLRDISSNLGLEMPLNLGGALDYGEFRVRVLGHEDFQQAVDLVGAILIRCARLEAHTKVIMARRLQPKSLLIFSPDALPYTKDWIQLDVFCARTQPVRDFPQLRWVAFQEFDSEKTIVQNLPQ